MTLKSLAKNEKIAVTTSENSLKGFIFHPYSQYRMLNYGKIKLSDYSLTIIIIRKYM